MSSPSCDSCTSGTNLVADAGTPCHTTFVVEEFSTLSPPTPLITMKTANSFYWSFINTLILNVATIAAIAVGIVQFAVRAYKDNNGTEKTRKVIQTVLQFVDTIVGKLLPLVDTDVPVVKVAQKTTKRR